MPRLKPYGIKEAIFPTGGWYYDQDHSGRTVRIPASGGEDTADHLCEAVLDYRINAGLRWDTVDQDVALQIARRSPGSRHKSLDVIIQRTQYGDIKKGIFEAVKDWCLAKIKSRLNRTSKHEAIERADICRTCRQNVKWQTSKCTACNSKIQASVDTIAADKLEKPEELNACRLHQFPIQAAVFLDRDELPNRHPTAPAPCWVHLS